jgi:polyribonucleotide nucleotidyltransferase
VNLKPIRKEFQYGQQLVSIETGEIARQASGAVMIDIEGTSLLVSVVGKKEASQGDFRFHH